MSFEVDKDFALLYGILLGDGCLSLVYGRKKFISITGSSRDDLPFFRDVISPILKNLRGKDTKIKFKKDCNAIDLNFTDNKLFDFIASFGFPIGKKGDRLYIPKIFYEKQLVDYVISGFFATDGSLVLTKNPNKYYPRLEIHVISKRLLEEVYNYLLNIGLTGAMYRCKRINFYPNSYNELHPKFRVQFNGKSNLILFESKIGFANPKYKDKFDRFIAYSNDYDESIKGISSKNVKEISIEKNEFFESGSTENRTRNLSLMRAAC